MPTILNGDSIPSLIYGSAIRASRKIDIPYAFRLGYRALDTASSRKLHNESADGTALGRILQDPALAVHRDKIWIQTKFSSVFDQDEPWPYDLGDPIPLQILKSVGRSLEDLGVDVLDAYFLSDVFGTIEEMMEAWVVMESLVAQGITRYLGVCRIGDARLAELVAKATIKPSFVQNEFKSEGYCDATVRDICKSHDIVYQIFGLFWRHNKTFLSNTSVQELANIRQISVENALQLIILASAAEQELKMNLLDGATCFEHLKENFDQAQEFSQVSLDLVHEFRKATNF
jgi:diketogulonate reductase-like aldo/keto reductase